MKIFDKIETRIRTVKIKHSRKSEYTIKTNFNFKINLNINRDVDRIFYINNFETETLNLFSNLVCTGNIIFDVGANIGIYSLIASKKLSKSGKVYAFEPSDWAYERLVSNIKLNAFNNIEAIKKGVSDSSGQMEFYLCEDDAYNSIGTKPMKVVINKKNIDVITLDEFCKQNDIEKVDILKIDTEGADYLVLKGGEKLLGKKLSPIIFCEYNRYTKARDDFALKDMLVLLKNLKYEIFELNNSKLTPFNSATSIVDEIICLKKEHYSKIPLPIIG